MTNPIHNSNRLKLGIFCYNTLSVVSLHPDVWRPRWADCVRAAQTADAMGLEALVPIARLKGYVDGDPENGTHTVFDAFTFAAGIAQATRHAAVFATVHGSVLHPLIVAKQGATIDHIFGGRFCLNVVGGVNRREFEMMGIELLGHDERYVHLDEWLGILKRLWSEHDEFDVGSRWFTMKGAISRPQPIQGGAVPIMNAGVSPQGMAFARRTRT